MAKKKKKLNAKGQLFMVFGIILCVVFVPTTIIFSVGMLPTIMAMLMDRSREKLKALTVGAMNFAGCMPFILEMWANNKHDVDTALAYVTEPQTIVIIYFAALMGYMIDWGMTGIVSTILSQKGVGRLHEIERIQEDLIERWGMEVTGEVPLDEFGFPVKEDEDEGN